MVSYILSWLAALFFCAAGAGIVALVMLANMMLPIPRPLGGIDRAAIAAGIAMLALGVLFFVLLLKGY